MRRERIGKNILTVLFVLISIAYMMPIVVVLFNSFKSNASINTSTFALPNAESFVGWANYQNGMTVGEYPFINSVAYSFVITILSAALILICTSMAAWYISRVDDVFSRVVYYLCVFSMIVPFQMVMFTLAKTANVLDLDTPWTIPVIYLGFGAGLAVFMFTGFVKGMPLSTAADLCARSSRWCSPCSSPSSFPWACWRSCGCGTTTSCPTWCWTAPSTRPSPSTSSICRAATAMWTWVR